MPLPGHPVNSWECPIPGKPCRVPVKSQGRVLGWGTLEEKAHWLDGASSLDAMRYGLQRVARRFCAIGHPEARCRAVQRWVRDSIRYMHDWRISQGQRGEEFADSETTIVRAYGDCDDKSRLFVALVRAAEIVRPMGTQARIRPVFKQHPLEFIHVQAEVRWPASIITPGAMPGGWLLSELILVGCEIGQNPDDMPRLPNGQRRIA